MSDIRIRLFTCNRVDVTEYGSLPRATAESRSADDALESRSKAPVYIYISGGVQFAGDFREYTYIR